MTWGEDYIALALRMEKHFEGFVDAYCGPPEMKTRIQKEEKQPLDTLFEDAGALLGSVPGEDKPRKIYLKKQVVGIKTTIQVLQGEKIDYTTQVERFFDIKPEKTPHSQLEKHKEVLQDIFKGQNLHEAVQNWRKSKEIEKEVLQKCIDALSAEFRKRTLKLLDLPQSERVDFVLVENKPWSGYNWYLGDYCSRVEINTDIPLRATAVPSLVSHEAYPGHHTDHCRKEQVLYRERKYTEACVFVYNTPECIISEGVASNALSIIFNDKKEAYIFLNEKMDLNMDVNADVAVSKALNELSATNENASLMIHQDNTPPSEVIHYLIDMGLSTRERAEKTLEFITHPLFRAYIFNYYRGEKLISQALKKMDVKTLYENQICPSNMKYFEKKK